MTAECETIRVRGNCNVIRGTGAEGSGVRRANPLKLNVFLRCHNLRSRTLCLKICFFAKQNISSDVMEGAVAPYCPLDPLVFMISFYNGQTSATIYIRGWSDAFDGHLVYKADGNYTLYERIERLL